ncbi:MAG: pilus assembly protein [Lacipirellulaceae bacterium]
MIRRSPHLSRRSPKSRHGLAVTELAVCLPVLTLIVLATIEACTMIFLQQSLSIATYEGARVALVQGAEASNVEAQCDLILNSREVQGATVTVTPSNFASTPPGEWIAVEASAPFSSNSLVGGWLFNGRTITARTEMMKEH